MSKTYGEIIVAEKEKMKLRDGIFVIEAKLPSRMQSGAAMKYYGEKLDEYWLSQIEISENSKITKKQILQILKGRNLNEIFANLK